MRTKNTSFFLFISIVVLLAYGLTLGMYIWQDDNAIMFKLQHLSQEAGVLGDGIYDRNTAYRFVIVPLVPLYYLFKLNPAGYYLAGLVVYYFATITIYYFTREATNNKKIAAASSLIFASGYVGGETLWRIFNSIHTIFNIIIIFFAAFLYLKFIKTRKLTSYLISLILFIVAMETGYVRAHGIIFIFLGIEILYNFHLLKTPILMAPFFAAYYKFYILDNPSSGQISQLLRKIFYENNLEILFAPLTTMKNLIVPNLYTFPTWAFAAIIFFILIRKRKQRVIPLSLIIMISGFLAPYIHNQGQIFGTIHRYLTLSSVGAAILTATVMHEFINNKKMYWILITTIAFFHLFLINKEQLSFLKQKSLPAKKFYESLTKEIKEIPKNSVIYFDIASDTESRNQFASFSGVGSMPDTTAIAIHYNIDRYDFSMPATFNELLSIAKNQNLNDEQIFTFFYDSNSGLINTSTITRNNLFSNSKSHEIKDMSSIGLPSTSTQLLTLKLGARFNQLEINEAVNENNNYDLSNYLSYFGSKSDYYNNTTATASSEWKYQEIDYAIDNNTETSWMAHRIHWHFERYEELIFDLSRTKKVGSVILTNRSAQKSISDYTYECSIDGVKWNEISHVYSHADQDGQKFYDKLDTSAECRFIKLKIFDTAGEDEPQIAEIEFVETEFIELDPYFSGKIEANPFNFANKSNEQLVRNYLSHSGVQSQLCSFSDKSKDETFCQNFRIFPNTTRDYEFFIPAQGTLLQKVEINSIPQINFQLISGTIKPLSLDELVKSDYIREYEEN